LTHARILVVGGHDPSGAGLDADRAALTGLDVEAHFVATALTDQDARAVHAIGARSPDEWLQEALAHAQVGVHAIKFGLLPGAAHIVAARRLVHAAHAHDPSCFVVIDPVISSSSGFRFLDEAAVEALRGELCGLGAILTPNLAEAAELAHLSRTKLEHYPAQRIEAARLLLGLGLAAVIIKGGHGQEDPVRDYLALDTGAFAWLEHPRVHSGKIRGSGCRFATHLAAHLALGHPLLEAAQAAALHVAHAIAAQHP
jgi:hydroxymethylpyrimidine/phosphomethylpyrimidine kinase